MIETEQWLAERCSRDDPVPRSPAWWLKRWLQHFRDHGAPDEALEGPETAGRAGRCPSWCSRRVLVPVLVLLALCVTVLLFIWNYQCIFVWHLCREEQPAVPLLWDTQPPTVDVEKHD